MDPKQMWNYAKTPPIKNAADLVITKLFCIALPIAHIAIGAIYLEDCPQQNHIPIFVLVFGVFGLLLSLWTCLPSAKETEEGGSNKPKLVIVFNALVSAFLFCWIISGIMDPKQMWSYAKSPPIKNAADLVITKLFCIALPIAQIAIGAIYLEDCPQQNHIPIFVLVFGVFGLLLSSWTCLPSAKETEEGGSNKPKLVIVFNALVSAFLFCWIISGSVWIYTIYPPNYNQTLAEVPYCNKTLYLFAFWTTTLLNILIALLLVVCCCFYLIRNALSNKSIN